MNRVKLMKTIIFLVCSIATLYYCILLILKYLENESLTQINIKNLNECQNSCYPSTTICIYSDDGNLMANLDRSTKNKCYDVMKGKLKDAKDLELCDFQNATFPSFFRLVEGG